MGNELNYVIKRIDNVVLVLLGPSFSLERDVATGMTVARAELDRAEPGMLLRIITDWTAVKRQDAVEIANAASFAMIGDSPETAFWSHPGIESIWHVNPDENIRSAIAAVQTPPFTVIIRTVTSLYEAITAAPQRSK